MPPPPHLPTSAPLPREEYVEQEHFFRVLRQRIQSVPVQDALAQIRDEILATTNLPLAIDFLRTEAMHGGRLNAAMERIPHYFTPFQTFVIASAEADATKFDMPTGLLVLERLAGYMAKPRPTRAGLFIFQFECVARNRLGYDPGLRAVAADPFYDEPWKAWIRRVAGRLGVADFADLVYYRSEEHVEQVRRRTQDPEWRPEYDLLFGRSEGRIAHANRGKDPLYMFAALQRQLGYPRVPRAKPKPADKLPPAVEGRLQRLEKRITLLEAETKGQGIDLSEFMKKPDPFADDPTLPADR